MCLGIQLFWLSRLLDSLCSRETEESISSHGWWRINTSYLILNTFLCFLRLFLSLILREEVTKLKFEAKTFHIYANQKEVSSRLITSAIFLFLIIKNHMLCLFCRLYGYKCTNELVCWTRYRTGRSSWPTLLQHQRPVSICGSVELRIRPFISESQEISNMT